MRRSVYLCVSAVAIMGIGCSQEESSGAFDDAIVESEQESVGASWLEVAPGVWERARFEGGFERMGFGVEGLRFALEQAHKERDGLFKAMKDSSAIELGDRIQKNQALIEYLQDSVDQVTDLDEVEPLPAQSFEVNSLVSSPSAVAGGLCDGSYQFDVEFFYGTVYGWVTTNAQWSEYGPFGPYKKNLHTYAYAWDPSGVLPSDVDEDHYGPFRGWCCVGLESTASISPIWSPGLYGSAYVSVTNGCVGFRSYERWNY